MRNLTNVAAELKSFYKGASCPFHDAGPIIEATGHDQAFYDLSFGALKAHAAAGSSASSQPSLESRGTNLGVVSNRPLIP